MEWLPVENKVKQLTRIMVYNYLTKYFSMFGTLTLNARASVSNLKHILKSKVGRSTFLSSLYLRSRKMFMTQS